MQELKKISTEKPAASLLIGIFYYLSALEAVSVFLYYMGFYRTNDWWAHPTPGGIAILISLFLSFVLFGSLGYYFSAHPKIATVCSNRLINRNIFIVLVSFLVLFLILLLIVIFNLFTKSFSPVQILNKHQPLTILAALLVLHAMSTLVLLRGKYLDEALPRLFQKIIKPGVNIGTTNNHRVRVLNFLQKNWFHSLIWIVMIIYLGVGPTLYARFIIKDGKPIEFNQRLPAPTDQIMLSADRLDPFTYNGQELYKLLGWSFYLGAQDQASYDRFIVLQSETRTYFFSTQSTERADVQKYFADLNLDLLNSGYSALISKDFIRNGNYHIGVLFAQQADNSLLYFASDKIVTRTANQLILGDSNTLP